MIALECYFCPPNDDGTTAMVGDGCVCPKCHQRAPILTSWINKWPQRKEFQNTIQKPKPEDVKLYLQDPAKLRRKYVARYNARLKYHRTKKLKKSKN